MSANWSMMFVTEVPSPPRKRIDLKSTPMKSRKSLTSISGVREEYVNTEENFCDGVEEVGDHTPRKDGN